jgi:putative tryptophan/tyrosine transport system substrate-binding protein
MIKRREFIAGVAGAAAWPLAARAQQPELPLIGFLSQTMPLPEYLAAFRQGLAETGFVEGRNVAVEYRSADGEYDRLPGLAADLVSRRVSVLLTCPGTPAALAGKAATQTIPIVFNIGTDPVEYGLVANLARPGGNMTGTTNLTAEVNAKRLELLHNLVPSASLIALLAHPANVAEIRQVQRAANILGLRLLILNVTRREEIEPAFTTISDQKVRALLVSGDPFLHFTQRDLLITLAARHAVPAIYLLREIVEAGGLMSYGPDTRDGYRLAGNYAGRILKGERPADLPVQQSVKFDLAINLKTAKALGLTFPESLLAIADEVIE